MRTAIFTRVLPEPLVSLPRDQETTGSGDENGLERTGSGDVTFKAGDNG